MSNFTQMTRQFAVDAFHLYFEPVVKFKQWLSGDFDFEERRANRANPFAVSIFAIIFLSTLAAIVYSILGTISVQPTYGNITINPDEYKSYLNQGNIAGSVFMNATTIHKGNQVSEFTGHLPDVQDTANIPATKDLPPPSTP